MLKDYETALKYCKLSKFDDLSAFFILLLRGLNSSNTHYHLVQDFLSSCLIFKYISIKSYRKLVSDIKVRTQAELFKNRVLRRILGRKREEATGDWRKLHDEKLHDMYSSPNF
jgi:hypothetical protein